MKKQHWWILGIAGAAGLAGMGIYRSYHQSWSEMKRAWRSFGRGKVEPPNSPKRETYFRDALRLFQQAIEHEPHSDIAEEALRMTGVTYGWLGMEEEALAALETAIERFPSSAGSKTGVYLAQAYHRNGQIEKAYFQAQRFLELSGDYLPPESWALRNALAVKAATARELGRVEEAENATRELEELSREGARGRFTAE